MLVAIFAFATLFSVTATQVEAQGATDFTWGQDYPSAIGLSGEDPRDMAANIVGVILGFLGILAVIIILIGGFKWMTAAGNEDKVGEAKKIIVAGIIGLVIIFASWGIANFVLDRLYTEI